MIKNQENGFTLIEVLIATGIFSVFMAVYMVAQGYNLSDSAQFSENMKLRTLAERVINQLVVNPPEFNATLGISKETKTFEDDDEYQYILAWKKFILPDLNKITGKEKKNTNDPVAQVEAKLFEKIKENMEKMIWQVEVTIQNKSTKDSYSVSTWLYNREAELTTTAF